MKTMNPAQMISVATSNESTRPMSANLPAIRRAVGRVALVASCILAPWMFIHCAANPVPSFPLVAATAISVLLAAFLPTSEAEKGGAR